MNRKTFLRRTSLAAGVIISPRTCVQQQAIFNLAFLGYDDLVRQLVTGFPHLLKTPGPHGFTLLHYAKVGERLGTHGLA